MDKLSSFRGVLRIARGMALWTEAAPFVRRVCADDRGAVFAVTAIAIIPLVIALGIVIDISRGYLARSELSYVIDSAGFVTGRSFDSEENFAGIWSLFDVDLNATSYSPGLADTVLQTALDKVANKLTIKAEAAIPTYFLHLAGIDHMIVGAEAVRTPNAEIQQSDAGNLEEPIEDALPELAPAELVPEQAELQVDADAGGEQLSAVSVSPAED